uniref:ribonuclease H n=1 Tax=Oryzias latipes TaxID=8090 RepID=A0A3P9HG26_ORYLA
MSKVLEKFVAEQLAGHLNYSSYNLHQMQFGFRKHHSTETAVCFLLENLKLKIDRGGVVGAVFLDLKKAFDTVNRDILTEKLHHFNLSPRTLLWLESYLKCRKQQVRVNNTTSSCGENQLELPQGSLLSPLLFSLYINDLPSCCPPNVQCQLYADDAVIYVHARDGYQAAQELTSAMNKVSEWLQKSQLILNVSKTVCMYFSKSSTNQDTPPVLINGTAIQSVSEYKYLGITIDTQLTFKSHIKKVVNSIKFNLSNFRHLRNNLTLEAAKLYYNAMIVSQMTYCMTSWASACRTILKPLQTVHKPALKTLDKKPKSHHNCKIFQKHNLLSFNNIIQHTDCILVYKILHGLAPPPLQDFVKKRQNRSTRASSRGDCIIPSRKSSFGQTVFSFRASQTWNTIPKSIRELSTLPSFSKQLRSWLLENQTCTHS